MKRKIKAAGNKASGFEEQFRKAAKRGGNNLKRLPKAKSARYEKKSRRMVFEMQNGVTLFVPVRLVQGLESASEKVLSDFDLMLSGSQIHWRELDVQFYLEDLLKGVFGTPNWMKSLSDHLSEIGRKGGSQKSESKTNAARANGAKGGRPARRVA
jgi:hypothetical protein